MTRDGEGHWLLRGSRTVWAAELQEVVTTKRAAYAAFLGDVPEGVDVRANCGVPCCIAPGHATLCKSRRIARALSLPDQLIELAKPEVFRPLDPPDYLPKGLTMEQVDLVKLLTKEGNTISQVRNATQLPVHEIMKIRGGVYDAAMKSLAASSLGRASGGRARRERSVASAPVDSAPSVDVVDQSELKVSQSQPVDENLSEEELAWLEQVGRG